jgi:hypothetical protein
MLILGLDISTSCTGVCVINDKVEGSASIKLIDRIEFKKCNNLWDKCDVVKNYIENIVNSIGEISRVAIEEPLMGFRESMSSAQTITTLIRFNGIVSYIAKNVTGCMPEHISAAHARKLCGMKLQKTNVGGPQKEQVFSFMCEHDLSHVVWEKKKNGNIVDWARDATDAYVIAKAAQIEGVKS